MSTIGFPLGGQTELMLPGVRVGNLKTAGKSIRTLGILARLPSRYTGDSRYLLISSVTNRGYVLWSNAAK